MQPITAQKRGSWRLAIDLEAGYLSAEALELSHSLPEPLISASGARQKSLNARDHVGHVVHLLEQGIHVWTVSSACPHLRVDAVNPGRCRSTVHTRWSSTLVALVRLCRRNLLWLPEVLRCFSSLII